MTTSVKDVQFFQLLPKGTLDLLERVRQVDRLVGRAVSLSMFSTDVSLGRWLIGALSIVSPRHAMLGFMGIILAQLASRLLSQNETLKQSGIFVLNGWFLGLAVASFFPKNITAFALIGCLPFISGMAVVVFDRFLRNWDLPQMVLPYVVSVWVVQILSMYNTELSLTIQPAAEFVSQYHLLTILMASLKGFGQIFLQNNEFFSLAVAGLLFRFRVMTFWVLIAAPVSATTLAFLVAGPHWAVTSGLTSFCAILLAAAIQNKFVTPTVPQSCVLIVVSGLFELLALQAALKFNIFALSAAYVAILWVAKLLTETSRREKNVSSAIMPW